jgi:septal ring factor EnvC (AmiA/AmiB activator)
MWPKALAQLIELAPHITRLIPMADRFLNSKAASEEASRNAMQQMAEGLRGDLGQVTASHAGLYRQLNDQSEKLSTLSQDVRATRLAIDSTEARITRLEQKLTRLTLLTILALTLLIALAILGIYIATHLHS